tara:strand:- start:81 stop:221 length:141 start_codon:yes stop_codon:yes gene_type:complete
MGKNKKYKKENFTFLYLQIKGIDILFIIETKRRIHDEYLDKIFIYQ